MEQSGIWLKLRADIKRVHRSLMGYSLAAAAGALAAVIFLTPHQFTGWILSSIATIAPRSATAGLAPESEAQLAAAALSVEAMEKYVRTEAGRETLRRALHRRSFQRQLRRTLAAAYRNDSDDTEIALLWGRALLLSDQPLKAIGVFQAVLEQQPGELRAKNMLGVSLLDGNHFKEAEESFKRIIADNPKNAAAYNNLGIALLSRAQFEEARAAFIKAIELDYRLWAAYDNLQLLYSKLDRGMPSAELGRLCAATSKPVLSTAGREVQASESEYGGKTPLQAIELYQAVGNDVGSPVFINRADLAESLSAAGRDSLEKHASPPRGVPVVRPMLPAPGENVMNLRQMLEERRRQLAAAE